VAAGFCLCVSDSLQSAADQKAQHFRDLIHSAHTRHQVAIYLSVPLSSGQGGYFPLNREIAEGVAAEVIRRFGETHAWVLNPAVPEADLPKGATQADYLYMWAQVLYGAEQAKDGVELVYFVGPEDVGRFLRLNGRDELAWLAKYFHHRVDTDPDFAKAVSSGKIVEAEFVAHYSFLTSVSFSVGAHDEWNLIELINQMRRAAAGITHQLPILFDGRAVPPPLYEATVAAGNVGPCR
jgi:hypothetical protein